MRIEPENENEQALERWLHAQLRQLPERAAPEGLVPAVLAALAARPAQPWWERPWLTWPWAAQALSSGAAAALLGALGFWGRPLLERVGVGPEFQWTGVRPFLASLWDAVGAWAGHWGSLPPAWIPWLGYGGLTLLLLYLACVGLGTVCFRLVETQRN